jgi:DNA primase
LIIPRDIIDEILAKLDIVDVIGERVSLKKTGANYKGLCPFHNEKTPSFIVNQDKQIFKCFGCNVGGDVIGFVEKVEGISFYDAVKKLAEHAGVKLPEPKNITPAIRELQDKKQELLTINMMARDYFVSRLKAGDNKGLEYSKGRKIGQETLASFYIGYADASWDGLSTHLMKKIKEMGKAVSLGLVKEKNGKYYDTFRERLMFPILNHRGEVVAFGGRLVGLGSEDSPKYINSKESDVYKKGEVLYGLYQTGKSIREKGYAIVVEGYMDFISLYQAGITNVIATLGTSFTERQVLLLRRYSDRVVLFYDSDKAGIEAAKRSFAPLLENGFKVDALFLDDDMDPDEAIQEFGKEKLEKLLDTAKPLMNRIIVDKFSSSLNMSDRPKVVSEILAYIGLIPDQVARAFWIKELSLRSGIAPRELNDLLRSYIRTQAKTSQNDTAARILSSTKIPHVYKHTIKSLFVLPDLLRSVFDEEWDAYLPEDLRNFLFSVKELYLKKGNLDVSDWIYLSRNTNFAWVESFLAKESINASQEGHKTEKTERTFYGCMIMFKMAVLEKKCQDSLSRIKNGEHSENTLREYNAIIVEIKQLKEMFGTIE